MINMEDNRELNQNPKKTHAENDMERWYIIHSTVCNRMIFSRYVELNVWHDTVHCSTMFMNHKNYTKHVS